MFLFACPKRNQKDPRGEPQSDRRQSRPVLHVVSPLDPLFTGVGHFGCFVSFGGQNLSGLGFSFRPTGAWFHQNWKVLSPNAHRLLHPFLFGAAAAARAADSRPYGEERTWNGGPVRTPAPTRQIGSLFVGADVPIRPQFAAGNLPESGNPPVRWGGQPPLHKGAIRAALRRPCTQHRKPFCRGGYDPPARYLLHPAIPAQPPRFCQTRRCPYNADTSKFLTKKGPVSPGQEEPPVLLGSPPKPSEAGLVGRGGARKRHDGCPHLGVRNRADFATTRSPVIGGLGVSRL